MILAEDSEPATEKINHSSQAFVWIAADPSKHARSAKTRVRRSPVLGHHGMDSKERIGAAMTYRRNEAKDHAKAHLKGIWAAALVPFAEDHSIDEKGFRKNLRHWVDDLGID